MKGKYQKPANKNRRYTHNRPYHGPWWDYGYKESDKAARKLMKGLRHKLLFHIPLTDEEELIVKSTGLTDHSQLTKTGGVRSWNTTDRWRFLNPKEVRRNETH